MTCVDNSLCMCRVPRMACSQRCIDVDTDPKNCGFCGIRCGTGASCVKGRCTDGPVTTLAPTVGAPFGISPFNGSDCKIAQEGKPVWYPNGGFGEVLTPFNFIGGFGVACGGIDCQGNSFSTGWTSYSNTDRFVQASGSICARADPWTTISGNGNVIYSAFVGLRKTGPGGTCNFNDKCPAISAITPANVASNTWHFPGIWTTNQTAADGPAIDYDWAGSALWAVALDLPTTTRLAIFSNCGAAAPGQAGCARTFNANVFSGITFGHPNVVVNPSTHRGILAIRDTSNQIRVEFRNVSGTLHTSFIAANDPFGSNAGCQAGGFITKCTGTAGADCSTGVPGEVCGRIVSRVQMAERYDGTVNKQYLYLATDQYCTTQGRFKARLRVYDITDETNPILKTSIVSSPCSTNTQEWGSVVETARGSPNSGWYYYRQNAGVSAPNPCSTDFVGTVTTSALFGSSSSTFVQISNGTFPTVIFAGPSMGDYVGTTDGLLFGVLNPTWSQPITTGAPAGTLGCVSCQGTKYTLRVMGNTITQ